MAAEEADEQEVVILPIDAFVRSIAVKSLPRAFFLGAGASVSSGIPSAAMCIWEWKSEIFLTNNPALQQQFHDHSLPSVRERIQKWFDSQGGYPPLDSRDEYAFYAESCYPIGSDRTQYFGNLSARAKPHLGYQLLPLLAEAGVLNAIWTTNFDLLVPKSMAGSSLTLIEVGLDTADRVTRAIRPGELLHVSLHGDYRYDALKNIDVEIREQDRTLREGLIGQLKDTSLIVTGYGGRDESVMEALREAYSSTTGTGALYWCGYEDEASPEVSKLLSLARANGRESYFIPTGGFDDLMSRLASHCLKEPQASTAREVLSTLGAGATTEPAPFEIELPHTTHLK